MLSAEGDVDEIDPILCTEAAERNCGQRRRRRLCRSAQAAMLARADEVIE
jgi:hypothetical protein